MTRSMVARLVRASVLLLLMSSPAFAQFTVNWQPSPSQGPIARIEGMMVYDTAHARMIMFGGYDLNFNRMNDLWEFDPAARAWTNRTPSPLPAAWPSRRSGHAMAYDVAHQRVMLFGGWTDNGDFLNGTHLQDMWEWDTNTKAWTNVTPSGTKPFARRGARMVYDGSRIVMFGGNDHDTYFPNPTPFGTGMDTATWIWHTDSRTWEPLPTTPASPNGRYFGGRTFHGMVYNSVRNRIWIYGGVGIASSTAASAVDLGDVWEFNGATNVWTDISPSSSPLSRSYAGMQFDPVGNRMIVHAGWLSDRGIDTDDTTQFVYSGGAAGTWTQLVPAPGTPMSTRPLNETFARDSHAMVYDPVRRRMVVFGGYYADVPEFNLNTNLWTFPTGILTTYWPPQQAGHALVYDTFGDSLYLMGGGAPEMYEGKLTTPAGWTTHYVPLLAPMSSDDSRTSEGMVYDSQRRKIVLFGGRQRFQGSLTPATVFGDTYEFDTAAKTWTRRATNGPTARYDFGMAYDAQRGQTILFGGRNASGTPLADTWLWNGNVWTQLAPATSPGARFGPAMSYDPIRGVIVLFGGNSNPTLLNDTWEWNGFGWMARAAATAPAARAFAAMSPFASAAAGVALIGGATGTSSLANDVWIWNGSAWTQASSAGPGPTPRQGARAVFNSAAQRIVLFGGKDAGGSQGDLWMGTITATLRSETGGDFDGDGKADVTVYRPSTGVWHVLQSGSTTYPAFQWGISTDKPVPGDYDGDSKTDIAIYRPATGTWYILPSSSNQAVTSHVWGISTDLPVPADYDGDGKTDVAIYRPSTGTWYVLPSIPNRPVFSYQWGVSTDIPVPGDYDGDGKTDIAIYRRATGTWYILPSSPNRAVISYVWGVSTDVPVSADYDGDGKTDVAIYRPSTGTWYVLPSIPNRPTLSAVWGVSSDVPVPADYDGDGKTDIAVFRASTGTWWVLFSSTNFTTTASFPWGVRTDIPVLKRP